MSKRSKEIGLLPYFRELREEAKSKGKNYIIVDREDLEAFRDALDTETLRFSKHGYKIESYKIEDDGRITNVVIYNKDKTRGEVVDYLRYNDFYVLLKARDGSRKSLG